MTLLPFNNRRACVKCGNGMTAVKYREARAPTNPLRPTPGSVCAKEHPDAEHLDVTCSACGYGWAEMTKDATGDGTLGLMADGTPRDG